MIKFFIEPLKQSWIECKDCWHRSKEENKKAKEKLIGLIYFNTIFIIGYSLALCAGLYALIGGIVIHPYGFLALASVLPFLIIAVFFRMKYYPKFKEYYLKDVT
ncbi:hypothetical protein GLW00_13095 [Halobacillus litoralis]|uniref:Uncharacterized protein n=1 Tax=Halobacillus litoralis TaxID=45668 RepID=A0A845FDT5_9BACI|nr:hypothetical protein [Halobacillus litoralis]MYL71796.1 hypothetical protein [Halobacillus litoralis]